MVEEDIISTLPDLILRHILSFLETKHAVTTTILSKRWKNLYRTVPVLHFKTTVTDEAAYFRFINFVSSVFLSRDLAFSVKTFHLDFTYNDYQIIYPRSPMEIVTAWINVIVLLGVECIDLCVELEKTIGFTKLPVNILTCNTLVVLNLHCFGVEEALSPVDLPSLKILHLDNILFPKVRDLMLFLNGCPILEDLFTFNVLFDSEESLTYDEWKSFCLSNLIRANIDCFFSHFPLKAVHNVHSLRLKIDNDKVHYLNDFIPTFHNLTKLELNSLDYSWQFLIKVLNHSPKLQELNIDQAHLNKETWTRKDDKENWVDPDVVPQCLSLHLRTCNLDNFLGLEGEVKLAKYILKNARVLQTMDIMNVGQANIKGLISSCPRASATCSFQFMILYHRRAHLEWHQLVVINITHIGWLKLLDYLMNLDLLKQMIHISYNINFWDKLFILIVVVRRLLIKSRMVEFEEMK